MDRTQQLLKKWSNHLVTPRVYRGPLHIKKDIYIGTIAVRALVVFVVLSTLIIVVYNIWKILPYRG